MIPVGESLFPDCFSSADNDHLMWKTLSSHQVFSCPVFEVASHRRESSEGQCGDFIELVCPEWVSVVPVFRGKDGRLRFVMERQYRHGTMDVTVEFPGGLVEKGEDPALAAARELQEETGIKAGILRKIGCVCPNSAFMNNRLHVFVAEQLEYTAERNLDENEQIDVFCGDADAVLERIGKEGPFSNGVMLMVAFLLAKDMKLVGKVLNNSNTC